MNKTIQHNQLINLISFHSLRLIVTSLAIAFFSLSFSLQAQDIEIYVCDAGNFNFGPWKILKTDADGSNPVTFIPSEELAWPQDILFLEDLGEVLISNLNTGKISRHNASNGDYIDDFATGIGGPTRMKIGADGLIYVLQWTGNGKVKRYQQDGTFVDDFTSVGVTNSIGIDWDSDGNLYVSSYSGDIVRKFDTNGLDLGEFISTGLVGPTNISFKPDGNMIVLDYDGGAVKLFDSGGNFLANLATALSGPEGISELANGDFLIGNGGTGEVKRFDSGWSFIENFVPASAGCLTPNAVIIRDVTTTSIENINVYDDFVRPTSGSQFFLDPDFPETISSIEIFDSVGRLIAKINDVGELIWDAKGMSYGVYFIHAKFEDGGVKVEKVVVR